MEVRAATQADVNAIARMWHIGWHQAHAGIVNDTLVQLRKPQEFETRTAAHLEQAHVAVVDGEIGGFLMVDGSELYQFYVGAAHQGRGLAASMMTAAETLLSPPRAWLGCTVGNDRAAAFYVKCGWENKGTEVFEAETSAGTSPVSIWRFEKDI